MNLLYIKPYTTKDFCCMDDASARLLVDKLFDGGNLDYYIEFAFCGEAGGNSFLTCARDKMREFMKIDMRLIQ